MSTVATRNEDVAISGAIVAERMTAIAQTIERQLDDTTAPVILGEGLKAWSRRISPDGERVTLGALVHLALLNDALVIAERAMMADDVITTNEAAYVTPLVRTALSYLVRFRQAYEDFEGGLSDAREFLSTHMVDKQPFGGKCDDTLWQGGVICRSFASISNDDGPLADYRETMVRLVDDIFELTKGSDPSGQRRLREEIERRTHLELDRTVDGREAAFCSSAATEVFHAVAHAEEVFEPDRMDVEVIHSEAREVFARTLRRIASINHRSRHGSMLLIKGDSGSGKTHLMRAFRAHVHEERLGYVGYLQMTSASGSYPRHVLTNLVESLDRPFMPNDPSSLFYIADGLMRWRVPAGLAGALRDEDADPTNRGNVVSKIVDHLLTHPEFRSIDVDLIRAFIYLAPNDPITRARVLRYLRCDELNDYDRQLLGGITTPRDDNAPLRMLAGIGKLVAAVHGGALVLLVDQLEDVYEEHDVAQQRFRQLMDTLRYVTDNVPTSLAVVSSLDDFYEKLRNGLSKPVLDRLEQDPKPVHITASRTRQEVEYLVQARLRSLFERHGARIREDESCWPFDAASISALAGLRTRDVLEWCRNEHERCVNAGRIVPPAPPTRTLPTDAGPAPLAVEWLRHRDAQAAPTDHELQDLLAWGLEHAGVEVDTEVAVGRGDHLNVRIGDRRTLVALCNASAQGGALGKQVDAVAHRAEQESANAVLVRCQEFPPVATKTKIAEKIGNILKKGGQTVVAKEGDWRTLAALRSFVRLHLSSDKLSAWLRDERPAMRLDVIRAVVNVDPPARSKVIGPKPTLPKSDPPAPISVVGPLSRGAVAPGNVLLGRTRSLTPTDVTRDPPAFMRHAAFLGSTGSGKTTLALNVIEQCIAHGVPALLVDRKGDLCRYGSDHFWKEVEPDPVRAGRKRALRDRVLVQVFTPGEHKGRPLALPIIPPGLGELDARERAAMSDVAAAGLCSMMGYKQSQQDLARKAILAKAIELLASAAMKVEIGIDQLIELLASEDSALITAIGRLDTKHFKMLVEHLSTLRLLHASLLAGGDRLSAELLFGIDAYAKPGKTTLSVVSTKFLTDSAVIDFWVSRLLIELTRWSSRRPSSKLQAIVMLDEADIYLPAQSKPATKQPMQDLLKRARSAGVGVFLATQSPGDLDYKCRDNIQSWFVGKVSEKTAVDKMRPLLNDYRGNPAAKLATARQGEFFVLADGNVTELKAERSLMNTMQLGEQEIIEAALSK